MNRSAPDTVAAFFAAYPLRTFSKRQLVIDAQETPTHIYYIIEGRVSQYDITPAGNEVVINIFKPGAFFPMSSAIHSAPSMYFFEASDHLTARQAPAADVIAFLKDNPDVLFDLLSRVYRGMDGVLRRMAHLMGSNAQSRLTFEVLNAAYRFGEQQTDGSIRIPLKEGDLGRHAGLTRETVSRCLRKLKAAGLVEVGSSGIRIKNVPELEVTLGTSL